MADEKLSCPWCTTEFTPGAHNQRFCKPACRVAFWRAGRVRRIRDRVMAAVEDILRDELGWALDPPGVDDDGGEA